MSDNVIKSDDLKAEKEKPVKKAATKKAAPAKKEEAKPAVQSDTIFVVFESGASYCSDEVSFTRDNAIQELPAEIANRLLELDNFRIANPFEVEEYIENKEA